MQSDLGNMIDALGKNPTESKVAMIVTIISGLEDRIVTLLPLLPQVNNREAPRMRIRPFTYPKITIAT